MVRKHRGQWKNDCDRSQPILYIVRERSLGLLWQGVFNVFYVTHRSCLAFLEDTTIYLGDIILCSFDVKRKIEIKCHSA